MWSSPKDMPVTALAVQDLRRSVYQMQMPKELACGWYFSAAFANKRCLRSTGGDTAAPVTAFDPTLKPPDLAKNPLKAATHLVLKFRVGVEP